MKKLLVGMSLKSYHHALLRAKGLDYREVELHAFTFDHDRNRVTAALESSDALVITSGRAIQALRGITEDVTGLPVYVVGQRTARRMARHGFSQVTSAHNCEELIALSPWSAGQKLLYLCGNLRRDILPDHWKGEGIPFTEIEVYQTRLLNPVVEPAAFDMALISSPSGVQSLMEKNTFPPDYAFASIGPVTSGELRKHGFNNILEPPKPSFELLLDEIANTGT